MERDELIYLDSDEEITAVIDRLRSTDANALRLVVPKGALVLQSIVSLKLLKREAERLQKAIAIVTQDPIGLHLGEQIGITVFAKPKDSEAVFLAPQSAIQSRTQANTIRTPDEGVTSTRDIDQSLDEAVDEQASLDTHDQSPEEVPAGLHVHRYDGAEDPSSPQAPAPRRSVNELLTESRRGTRTDTKGLLGSLGRIGRIVGVLAVLGAVGTLAFLQVVPRATIDVVVATEPLDQTVTVLADANAQMIDSANATIPGRKVSADVTIDKSAPATGKKQVGTKATATLTLYNYWDSNSQPFAVGTKFQASDGTTFVSTAAATIPGASTTLKEGKVVTTPGKTSVTVEAEQPGVDANGKSGTLTIPSIAQVRRDKIYGEAVAATAGGTSKEVTIVTTADRDALKNTAQDSVTSDGKTQLADQVQTSRLLDNAYQVEIKEETYSANVGDEVDELTLHLVTHLEGIVFEDTDLSTAALAVLNQSIPSARIAVIRETTDQWVATAGELKLVDGKLAINAQISTRTAVVIETADLIQRVTGQTLSEAEAAVRATTGVVDVTIRHSPSWLTTLPKRDEQVTMQIIYQESEPAP